jgi:putative flippase GtrA
MPPKSEISRRVTTRFLKYFVVGSTTFVFDLALLFFFADVCHFNYAISAGVAYLIAITINYIFSRRYVFTGTLRSARVGYVIFLVIAGVGFLLVTGFVYIFVQTLGLNLFVSRILVAGIAGIWNYAMNLYVNFKVDPRK